MNNIIPSAELRNNYAEISKLCHDKQEPIFITKNGYSDLVVMSNELYKNVMKEIMDELIDKHFKERYPDFDNFKNDIEMRIDLAMEDIKNEMFVNLNEEKNSYN